MTIDVLLFGHRAYEQPLTEVGLNVVQFNDFEAAAAKIQNIDRVKVLLFEGHLQGGSGFDLVQILRAKQGRCFVGQTFPAAVLRFVDPSRLKMDFWIGDPLIAADVVDLVARYERGEGGPPSNWNGLFRDPEDYDYAVDFEPSLLAWHDEAEIEDMRRRLSTTDFNKWLEMVTPAMNERLRRAQNWQGPRGGPFRS